MPVDRSVMRGATRDPSSVLLALFRYRWQLADKLGYFRLLWVSWRVLRIRVAHGSFAFPRVCSHIVVVVVFAALAVHAAGGLQYILRVEAAQCAGLQDLIHGVLGDHHPLRCVRHR